MFLFLIKVYAVSTVGVKPGPVSGGCVDIVFIFSFNICSLNALVLSG